MFTVRRYDDLGRFQNSWLNAHYHFSFSGYHDPNRMGLGELRVINDDIVSAGGGFDPHPHRDMEIITYVRSGSIRHRDNLGNEGVTAAGDVQVMSAGTGITHAEYADGDVDTTLYQIWIHPHTRGLAPRWEQAAFPKTPVDGQLKVLASGHEADVAAGALRIHAHAAVHGGQLRAGSAVSQPLPTQAYLLVSKGTVRVGEVELRAGDGAQLEDEPTLNLTAMTDAELVLITLG